MTQAEFWWLVIQAIAVGATVFGLIVGLFSIYNGRMTRRELGGLIQVTQELIARETQATRELIEREMTANRLLLEKLSNQHERMLR